MNTLPERLVFARKRLDMSQGDVAEAVGMKQPSYGQMESGETKKSKIYSHGCVIPLQKCNK